MFVNLFVLFICINVALGLVTGVDGSPLKVDMDGDCEPYPIGTAPEIDPIIGSGISGISAAYHLQNNHAVTIFETSSKLGGHSNTITVEDDDAKLHHIDTGFIVYNDRNYPGFLKFLNDA